MSPCAPMLYPAVCLCVPSSRCRYLAAINDENKLAEVRREYNQCQRRMYPLTHLVDVNNSGEVASLNSNGCCFTLNAQVCPLPCPSCLCFDHSFTAVSFATNFRPLSFFCVLGFPCAGLQLSQSKAGWNSFQISTRGRLNFCGEREEGGKGEKAGREKQGKSSQRRERTQARRERDHAYFQALQQSTSIPTSPLLGHFS